MTVEHLEQQLEKWNRILMLFLGMGLTLVASVFCLPIPCTLSVGWALAWLALQLGTTPLALLMLFGADWCQLPLARRLNTALGFLSAAWLGWLALGLCLSVQSFLAFASILLPGMLLALVYLLRRRAGLNSPEEIFP
jgi:hypothetical protein